MIPGAVTFYWFTPTKTGGFDVLCAELCGYGHPYMRGRVVVDDETQYQAWLQGRKPSPSCGHGCTSRGPPIDGLSVG